LIGVVAGLGLVHTYGSFAQRSYGTAANSTSKERFSRSLARLAQSWFVSRCDR
jgi:hypothetical protein